MNNQNSTDTSQDLIDSAICVKRIVVTSPPDKRTGKLPPAVLVAAQEAGAEEIYKIGGAQAIAAMAYGTETIDPVYKIFGPGNQFVTVAKQLVQMQGVCIDMPAGPSEVCVIADEIRVSATRIPQAFAVKQI